MLTPLDIQNQEFRKTFRGYNEVEVDEFLEQVLHDYEELYRTNIDLRETTERLKSQIQYFQNLENTLHNTLVVAQEAAEEVKVNARKEAELLRKEAEVESRRILDEANVQLQRIQTECDEQRAQGQLFRSRMRMLAQSQLEMLEEKETRREIVE
nr:DivIVA domain-containing protein [uncultured Anaeromusa sp.]